MNNEKLAQAFLQLSQALATIHQALLEQSSVSEAQVRANAAVAQPAQTEPPPPAASAPATVDQFAAFADQLRNILQTVPPGALNVSLGQMIERYAPGAGAPGKGGIRKIPEAQYANFLNEVRAAAAALGGQ